MRILPKYSLKNAENGGIAMANSHSYFENRECKYYPCHKGSDNINCLFCYCPLYHMTNCPGNYRMVQKDGKAIKTCIDCMFPHIEENYEKINQVIKTNNMRQ